MKFELIPDEARCLGLIGAYFAVLLVSACTRVPANEGISPTPKVIGVVSPDVSPTRKPSPTIRFVVPPETPYPTHTTVSLPESQMEPTQSLQGSGPYLVYFKTDELLVLRDPDGGGTTAFSLPNGTALTTLSTAVSPSGEWMAFCAGHPWYSDDPNWEPDDFALQLMHLPDGEIQTVTPLLSADWPDNFEVQAELLNARFATDDDPETREVSPDQLKGSFGIVCSFDWSYNGRNLAFAGEMDGPTWDLYTYDIENGSMSRLSSGIENVVSVSWSPEAEYILHTSAYTICVGGCERWWVSRSDGSEIWELDVPGNIGRGWVTNELYSVYTGENGPGRLNIYNVNVLTNEITSVWPYQFDQYIFDPVSGNAGIGKFAWEDLPSGFFLYDPLTGELDQIFEDIVAGVEYWGNGEFAFIVSLYNEGTFAVRAGGSYVLLSESPKNAHVSPDKDWIVFTSGGVQLYTPDGETLNVAASGSNTVIWRPDSSGFYYLDGNQLFYVPVDDPDPTFVDLCLDELDYHDVSPTWAK